MRSLLLPSCLLLAFLPALAAQAGSSSWHEVEGGSIRLVTDGVPDDAGKLRGALEIRLKPGWKTYWRDPGAAGVPPSIAARTGTQEAAVEIFFPAPRHFPDDYAPFAGYDRPVSLALTLALPEGAEASRLEADIFLGLCETICIPVQATLSVDAVSRSGGADHSAVVEQAFAALPRPAGEGFAATLAAAGGEAVLVAPALPQGVHALDLFVAGTPTLTLGMPEKIDGHASGTMFRVPVASRAGEGAEELAYTLVTDRGAVSGRLKLP